MEGGRRWLLVVWCGGLVAGTALFHSMGAGALSPPPLEPAGWAGWIEGRGGVIATVAVLRLVVLGLSWYLVGVTTIGLVARLLRAARLLRIADAVTVPWVRRLLQQGLGVTLAATMVVGAAGAPGGSVGHTGGQVAGEGQEPRPLTALSEEPHGAAGPEGVGSTAGQSGADRPEVRLEDLPIPVPFGGSVDAPPGVDSEVSRRDGAARPPSPTWLPEPVQPLLEQRAEVPGGPAERSGAVAWEEPGATRSGASGAAEPDRDGAAATTAGSAVGTATDATDGDPHNGTQEYVVVSGDSLWRIAQRQLERSLGSAPSDAEIVPYWRVLIERNRAGLPDPDDPDLILPGQRLTLPSVPDA